MRKSNPLPPKSDLDRIFHYEPKTGVLIWKVRTEDMFNSTEGRGASHACAQWNSRFAGKEALTKVNKGYRCGHLFAKPVLAHRVIWKLMQDEEPNEVDHIDGDRLNNRWINLRNVTTGGNRKNAARRADNRSGVTGVHWHKRTQSWRVFIEATFPTFEEAVEARHAAAAALGFHPNHGRKGA